MLDPREETALGINKRETDGLQVESYEEDNSLVRRSRKQKKKKKCKKKKKKKGRRFSSEEERSENRSKIFKHNLDRTRTRLVHRTARKNSGGSGTRVASFN